MRSTEMFCWRSRWMGNNLDPRLGTDAGMRGGKPNNTIAPDSRAVIYGTQDATAGLRPGLFAFGKVSPAMGYRCKEDNART